MRNPEERKKLLEQIAELERNSINYFDVEKEFFLITSDNLHMVRPRLYGYSIQRDGIYEDDNLTEAAIAGLDGRGCYVYVDVRDGKITIKQDINGCWGIYLFRRGDYFALSNSFFRLLDYVKFRYPLTVNRDYCHHMIVVDGMVSLSCYETAVNEIQLVERNAILHIDIAKKNLEIELIDQPKYAIPLDSQEGIDILDCWVEFYADIFRHISQHASFITVDLSGGFDSRMSLLLALHSGIDLNKVTIYSSTEDAPAYKEDFDIALEIAKHYGFKLNLSFHEKKDLRYSLFDIWNKTSYLRQPFHKLPYFHANLKNDNKTYRITGQGGEVMRESSWMSFTNFLSNRLRAIDEMGYSSGLSKELSRSMENIIQSSFNAVCEKYKINDPVSKYIPKYIYQDTHCRTHFGKDCAFCYFNNVVKLMPLMDPEIRTLQFNTKKCSDANLFMALLYIRYEPDLLTFPFQGGRSIAPQTIAYAKQLNERFPPRFRNENNMNGRVFNLKLRDIQTKKISLVNKKNESISRKLLDDYMKAVFDSSRTHALFVAYFDEELYQRAAFYYDNHATKPGFRMIYPIIGIVKCLEDVEISQHNHPQYQGMKRFLEQDFATIHDNEEKKILSELLSKFSPYLTARVDVRFFPKDEQGDFQILSCSDGRAKIKKPEWLNKDDVSYMITSYIGDLELVAKAMADGQIRINLWTLDYRDPENKSKKIPYWIDYTKLIVNDKTIFDKVTPAWHGKAYNYSITAKANEEIKIYVEWLPHRSDT